MKRENVMFKKRYLLVLLFVALIGGISFGYANLRTTLSINGTTTISKVTWSVVFDNLVVTTGSHQAVDSNDQPINSVVLSDNDTTLTYNITLDQPGDFYEFKIDVHNTGTLKAKLDAIRRGDDDTELTTRMQQYFNYTETGLQAKDTVLNPDGSYTITIRLDYKADVTPEQLPTTGDVTTFKRTIHLDYIQDR